MLTALLSFCSLSLAPIDDQAPNPAAVLVAFQPTASDPSRQALIRSLGLAEDKSAANPYFYRLTPSGGGRSRYSVPDLVDALRASNLVRVAEPDWTGHVLETIPNDARFGDQWGMRNTGQSGGVVDADIDATLAWDIATGDPNLKVALVDTGMSYSHVDLSANAWTNPGEIPGNNIDDDGNGRIDDIHGYDFVNNDGNPIDDHSHGTMTSGIVAAVGNNGIGVAGVCWNAKLIACKAFNSSGVGFLSNAIIAIDYARMAGAKVISNSYAFNVFSQLQLEAVQRAEAAGIVVVAGAGNNNANSDVAPVYPAGLNTMSSVLSVGASDRTDHRASFSNFGVIGVDLFAPGVDVMTTYPGNIWVFANGTSMSCPQVSGAAALLLSRFPSETPAEIKERLRATAERVPSLAGLSATGRLDLNAAIRAVRMPISGTVILQDWNNSPDGQVVKLTLRQGDAEVESSEVVLANGGHFSVTTTRSGVHELVAKGTHWLGKKLQVDLQPPSLGGLVFVLVNADADGDNEIGIGDYALLSTAYGAAEGEPNWNPAADFNGDQFVDIGDYAILSANYGQFGD